MNNILILKKVIIHKTFQTLNDGIAFHATGLYALSKSKNYSKSPLQVKLRIINKMNEIERKDFPEVTVILKRCDKK